jgi:aconitate hydratase
MSPPLTFVACRQGLLPLTFADPSDYDRISGTDDVSLVGLSDLKPGSSVTMVVHKESGDSFEVKLNHTFNEDQLEWFKAGSALNAMKAHM